MTSTISVTQGLAELKLLDKRLLRGLDCIDWIAVSTKHKKIDHVELGRKAQADYQSFMDLVKRRDTIKRAIVQANATTQITIGTKWSGSVAEAIEQKVSIQIKKKLLEQMKVQIRAAENDFQKATEESNNRLDRLLTSELGKDIKTNPETIATLTASFQDTNKVTLVDPLNLKDKVKELESEIETFETNVDWVLSEINGKTMITV
jgi:hypothetical protein